MRTDVDSVKAIIDSALTDPQINAIIAHANRLVTLELGGEGLSDALLKDIETWMTAHLIAIGKERHPESEKTDDIWLTYQKKPQEFLKSTSYGQMVLTLDSSGKLQAASKQRAYIRAIKQVND